MRNSLSRPKNALPAHATRAALGLLVLIILLPLILRAGDPAGVQRPGVPPKFHPHRILIRSKTGELTSGRLSQIHATNGARVLREFPRIKVQVLEFTGAVDIHAKIESY